MGSTEHTAFTELAAAVVEVFSRDNATTLTYRRRVRGQVSATTVARAYTETDTSVDAVRHASRSYRSETAGGSVVVHEVDYLIKATALTYVPKEGDQVFDPLDPSGSVKKYHVYAVDMEVNDKLYRVRCRNVPVLGAGSGDS